MERQALVIEDQKDVLEGVIDQILSLGDNCEVVSNQYEALKLFLNNQDEFDYMVSEINMLARPNSPCPSCENGIRFIQNIRQISPKPFFVVASSTLVCQGYAVKAMKLGANDVIAYPLPPMGRTLGKAVEKIFNEFLPFDKNIRNCQPRQIKGGIINLTKEGVEICGVLICDYQENGEAGRLFEILAEVNCYGRRIRLSAQKLAKIFDISQQAVFTMLKRLRKKIRDELLKFGILCDPQSIIPNQDGYHISDNFEIYDNRKNNKKKSKPPTDNLLFEYPEITDRRELWILEQCCKGVKLQRIDIDKKFNQSPVTSSRLLAKLRQEGIIEFVGNGSQGYWQMVDSQRAIKCPVVLQS